MTLTPDDLPEWYRIPREDSGINERPSGPQEDTNQPAFADLFNAQIPKVIEAVREFFVDWPAHIKAMLDTGIDWLQTVADLPLEWLKTWLHKAVDTVADVFDVSSWVAFLDTAITSAANLVTDSFATVFDWIASLAVGAVRFVERTCNQDLAWLINLIERARGWSTQHVDLTSQDHLLDGVASGGFWANLTNLMLRGGASLLGINSPLNAANLFGQWGIPLSWLSDGSTQALWNPGFDGPNALGNSYRFQWDGTVYRSGSTDAEPGSVRVTADGEQHAFRSHKFKMRAGQKLDNIGVETMWHGLSVTPGSTPLKLSLVVDTGSGVTHVPVGAVGLPGSAVTGWTGAPSGAMRARIAGTEAWKATVDCDVCLRVLVDSTALAGDVWFDEGSAMVSGGFMVTITELFEAGRQYLADVWTAVLAYLPAIASPSAWPTFKAATDAAWLLFVKRVKRALQHPDAEVYAPPTTSGMLTSVIRGNGWFGWLIDMVDTWLQPVLKIGKAVIDAGTDVWQAVAVFFAAPSLAAWPTLKAAFLAAWNTMVNAILKAWNPDTTKTHLDYVNPADATEVVLKNNPITGWLWGSTFSGGGWLSTAIHTITDPIVDFFDSVRRYVNQMAEPLHWGYFDANWAWVKSLTTPASALPGGGTGVLTPGRSDDNDGVSWRTDPTIPPAPTGLVATPWLDVTGPNFPAGWVTYAISAVKDGIEGPAAQVRVFASTLIPPNTNARVDLAWNAMSGYTFRIYRQVDATYSATPWRRVATPSSNGTLLAPYADKTARSGGTVAAPKTDAELSAQVINTTNTNHQTLVNAVRTGADGSDQSASTAEEANAAVAALRAGLIDVQTQVESLTTPTRPGGVVLRAAGLATASDWNPFVLSGTTTAAKRSPAGFEWAKSGTAAREVWGRFPTPVNTDTFMAQMTMGTAPGFNGLAGSFSDSAQNMLAIRCNTALTYMVYARIFGKGIQLIGRAGGVETVLGSTSSFGNNTAGTRWALYCIGNTYTLTKNDVTVLTAPYALIPNSATYRYFAIGMRSEPTFLSEWVPGSVAGVMARDAAPVAVKGSGAMILGRTGGSQTGGGQIVTLNRDVFNVTPEYQTDDIIVSPYGSTPDPVTGTKPQMSAQVTVEGWYMIEVAGYMAWPGGGSNIYLTGAALLQTDLGGGNPIWHIGIMPYYPSGGMLAAHTFLVYMTVGQRVQPAMYFNVANSTVTTPSIGTNRYTRFGISRVGVFDAA